jgi:hypothetical protein
LKETIAEFVLSNPFTFFNFQLKTFTKVSQFTDDQKMFVLGKYYEELNIDIMKWELNEMKKRNIPRYIVPTEEILKIRNLQLSNIKKMSKNIQLKEILRNQSNSHSLKIRQMRESFNQSINQLQQETYIIKNQFHPVDQNVIYELSWKYECQRRELSISLNRAREQLAHQLQRELESYRNRNLSNRY